MARNKSWGEKTCYADCGAHHRGGHGRKARGVKARKRAIERKTRRAGKAACREGLREARDG
jgi:hypothetical protein